MSEVQTNADPMVTAMEHYESIRGDAAKAVEAAIAAEAGEPAPVEPGEDHEAPDEPAAAKKAPVAVAGDAQEAEEEDSSATIRRILNARDKAAKEKTEAQKAREEAEKLRSEIAAEREALAKERESVAAERARVAKLKDIRQAPEALKELGWDPDEFIVEAARANTYEGKLAATIRSQQEALAALQAKAEAWEKQSTEREEQSKKAAEAAQAKQVEETFQKVAFDAEKYPALVHLYDDEREILLMKAHDVARRYRAATGGEEATFDMIAQYLDEKAEEKIKGAKQQAAPKNGKAPPAGRPSGKRTLTGADSSARSSVPGVEKIDDEDERRRRAIAAADKAIRESA